MVYSWKSAEYFELAELTEKPQWKLFMRKGTGVA
jgi:hypothetical protein